ncbi:hypothetical protein I79_020620 [Cricetulus griseus]|uniref:Uncharacterized protein n=1 Tax=Cricetulus griseus TaxID=10029 RepID=G3IAJ7_CRIGR|nr:hypothetical protein I79_020620 [Cricetulus griseus]
MELSHRVGENHEKRQVRCPESNKTIEGAHWYACLPSELNKEQLHSQFTRRKEHLRLGVRAGTRRGAI